MAVHSGRRVFRKEGVALLSLLKEVLLPENIDALLSLLNISAEDVDGLLERFNPSKCENQPKLDVHFYHIRFQGDKVRIANFISKLCDCIVPYCLNRHKFANPLATQIRQIELEAKGKFAHPANGKTGEPGELIVYYLLEGCLRAPKVFSKMSLKTNSQMHIHGSDGVHVGIERSNLILYFGESKLYKVHTAAIADAIDSVKKFTTAPDDSSPQIQQDFEIKVLSDNIDIPEGDLRSRLLDALDPYSAARSDLRYVYTCLIGFDMEEIDQGCDSGKFQDLYQKKAESCYKNLIEKIEGSEHLKSLSWKFFFLPFGSVEKFREEFLKELEK